MAKIMIFLECHEISSWLQLTENLKTLNYIVPLRTGVLEIRRRLGSAQAKNFAFAWHYARLALILQA